MYVNTAPLNGVLLETACEVGPAAPIPVNLSHAELTPFSQNKGPVPLEIGPAEKQSSWLKWL
jgi:hypothetical protein